MKTYLIGTSRVEYNDHLVFVNLGDFCIALSPPHALLLAKELELKAQACMAEVPHA